MQTMNLPVMNLPDDLIREVLSYGAPMYWCKRAKKYINKLQVDKDFIAKLTENIEQCVEEYCMAVEDYIDEVLDYRDDYVDSDEPAPPFILHIFKKSEDSSVNRIRMVWINKRIQGDDIEYMVRILSSKHYTDDAIYKGEETIESTHLFHLK